MTEMTVINEDVIKAVIKKLVTSSSSENMPFESLSLTITKSGYGFLVKESKKNRLSVRNNHDKIFVYISNDAVPYNLTYIISDTTKDKLTTDSATESYKKYCINTLYTIYKTWISCHEDKKPDLGSYSLYKY